MKLAYRPDIDGMRALAVAAVILFHSFPEVCPGGFTGVDIFFVISGYLITSIILADLVHGTFSFSSFYARRIRRIFPALSMVLAFCLICGWFILFPQEWHALSRNVLAGAGFFSNFLNASQNGYFDPSARAQPLLHLWSLGIEEQFYIFWPVTLVLLWKRPRWTLAGTLIIAALSFSLDIAYLQRDPVQAFYNPAMRMWELLAGALLARFTFMYGEVKRRVASELLSSAGLALIAAGFVVIDPTKPSHSWWNLLPVVGTMSLVRAGANAWPNRWLLAWKPAVFVGLISYPLYLWHWPLLVFARLLNQSDFHLSSTLFSVLRVAMVLLAFLLSWATYEFWERPIRSSVRRTSSFGVRLALASMVVVVLFGMLSLKTGTARLNSPAAKELARVAKDMGSCENWEMAPLTSREIPSQGNGATLLVGDSDMAQYEQRIKAAIRANPRRATGVFATSCACPPLPGMNPTQPGFQCPAFYNYWTSLAMQPRFSTVAVASIWFLYYLDTSREPGVATRNSPDPLTYRGKQPTRRDFDDAWSGLEATLGSLVKAGKRVVIVASSPFSDDFAPDNGISRLHTAGVWRLRPVPASVVRESQAKVNSELEIIARRSGAEVIWPVDYLCHDDVCPALDTDGSPIYVDNAHIRASKAAKLATFMDDLVRTSER